MIKIKLLLILSLLIAPFNASAQKVQLKNGKVLIDKMETFKYDKSASHISLYELDSNNEIIFVQWMDNGTLANLEDDYIRIHFIELDLVCETSRFAGHKWVIKELIKENIINNKGEIDNSNIKKFVKKRDENITNRTIRN